MSLNALAPSEVTQGIAQGKFSAAQVLDASIARIEATNARVNAFTAMHLERARNQAKTIDGWRATGEPLPPVPPTPPSPPYPGPTPAPLPPPPSPSPLCPCPSVATFTSAFSHFRDGVVRAMQEIGRRR